MGERVTAEQLAAWRAIEAAATKGPWQWFGNRKMREVDLATVDRGRVFVMQFHRWGFSGAQPRFQVRLDGEPGFGIMQGLDDLGEKLGPKMLGSHRNDFIGIGHPDAVFLAEARVMVPALIAEVERLRVVVEAVERWADDNAGLEDLNSRTELELAAALIAYRKATP